MFRKTDEVKVLRDPVHGYIHVEYEVIWQCINSRWMQRLRRIRQLGGAHMVYHAADHSRFQHSLGVYEIVRRMVTEVQDLAGSLTEQEKVTVMLAGLMHDIGHGPYSHAFEAVTPATHEEYTCEIIEQDPELRGYMEACVPGLAGDVADVIRHRSANPILPQLVSAQLDADRMDYLLRDAYFTGTKYGVFDLERLLRTLRVSDNRLVVKESGVYAVEYYIMARYHMYWQVYYHPIARSYESLIAQLFVRLRDLADAGKFPHSIPEFEPLAANRKLSLDEFFVLDEYTCSYGFQLLSRCDDPVAADLASRLRDRRLFDYAEGTPQNIEKITAALQQQGYDPKYYLAHQAVRQRPYEPYSGQRENAIWIRMHGGEIRELSAASSIVASLIKAPLLSDNRVFFPVPASENQ